MLHRLHWLVVFTLAAALGCRTSDGKAAARDPAAEKKATAPSPIRLTLIATNDIHGWVYPHSAKLKDGSSYAEGGVAYLSSYLSILRAENPGGTLLLDAGDLFQGTLAANVTEGSVVIDAYNYLRYDAAAIGNHEFDYGPVGPVSVAQPGMDPFGALKARMAEAKFPILAVNIYEAKTGERPAWLPNDGTLMLEVKGVRVGIVGLVTPTTPQTTNPVNVSTLRFGSLVPEAQTAAERMRAKGAELVIAVAHAGGKCGSCLQPRDTSSCDLDTAEIFDMIRKLPPKTFDAVIAGHTHNQVGHFVEGTPVIESYGLGRYLGTIDLFLDPQSHKVLENQTEIHPVIPVCPKVDPETNSCESRVLGGKTSVSWVQPTFRGKPVVKDEALEKLLAPALAKVEAEQQRRLGIEVPAALTRNYESESPLGSFLADSLREAERADVALLNPGGFRSDLPAGEMTYGAIYEVIPFDNTIATVTVSGDELRRLLGAAFGSRKGVFQVSGLSLRVSRCPSFDRLKVATLSDGKPLVADRKYRVVMPDFLARGGDGLGAVLASLPPGRVDFGDKRPQGFRDALVSYWQKAKRPVAAPAPGRIAFVDDGSACSSANKLDGHSGLP